LNENNYVIALDVSLSSTGVCIFDKNGNPVSLFNIPTTIKLGMVKD
jgi:glycerol kinase